MSAAWELSSLSSSRAFTNLLPSLLLLVLIASYTTLYVFVPAVRSFGDRCVESAYNALPDSMQAAAARMWHMFLPQFMLNKVPPLLPLLRSRHYQVHVLLLLSFVLPQSRAVALCGSRIVQCIVFWLPDDVQPPPHARHRDRARHMGTAVSR